LPGSVRVLEGDNGADESFAIESEGHLVAAGRYDGMDFPDDVCRVEVLPEIPLATTDLEEWTSAYLRDAGFADARFSQRLAQALGRCNRSKNDRAVYVLADAEFLGRLSQRRVVDSLPDDVRADVFAALHRSDSGFGLP
jgi:Rad3-related DNA helicase